MKRIILITCHFAALGLPAYSQSFEKFSLPNSVISTFSNVCCNCTIKEIMIPLDRSVFHIDLIQNGQNYIMSIDSAGNWLRTSQQVEWDSIPADCRDVFYEQLMKHEQNYTSSHISSSDKEIADEPYGISRVLKEFDSHISNGYYEFTIQKPESIFMLDQDTLIRMDTQRIKIDFNCHLLNYYGKQVIRTDGDRLLGYTYFINDSSTYSSNTSIVEYACGKKNGLYIQYFNYPDKIASVDYYVNDEPQGPFYSYYPNGQIKEIGFYENGIRKMLTTLDK